MQNKNAFGFMLWRKFQEIEGKIFFQINILKSIFVERNVKIFKIASSSSELLLSTIKQLLRLLNDDHTTVKQLYSQMENVWSAIGSLKFSDKRNYEKFMIYRPDMFGFLNELKANNMPNRMKMTSILKQIIFDIE